MNPLSITILGTLLGTLLALEAKAWIPYLSTWLMRTALAGMPEQLNANERSRWGEEIEADLTDYSERPLGGLVFALNLRRKGGRRLAAELILQEALTEAPTQAGESPFREIHPKAKIFEGGDVDGRHFVVYEPANGHLASRLTYPEGRVVESTHDSDVPGFDLKAHVLEQLIDEIRQEGQ
jgi:hypothetical protein